LFFGRSAFVKKVALSGSKNLAGGNILNLEEGDAVESPCEKLTKDKIKKLTSSVYFFIFIVKVNDLFLYKALKGVNLNIMN
jgi:hypothetical protein